MKNPKNPTLLHEVEHAGLGAARGHWSLDDYVSELASPDSRLFYIAGSMEGFVLYRDVAGDVEIMNLAVRTKGQGHGTLLLQNFLSTLFGSSPKLPRKIFLEVAASNVSARRIYEKLGFREGATRRAYYRSGEDAVLYSREASAGDVKDV